MIFVTVGSRPYKFDRLIKKVDELIERGIIKKEVFMQIGTSNYEPKHCDYARFLPKEEFDERINKCSILLTHAGVGIIMTALKQEKKIITVPRRKKYKEHIDDHQTEICDLFLEKNILHEVVYNIEELEFSIIKDIPNSKYNLESNIVMILNDFLIKN